MRSPRRECLAAVLFCLILLACLISPAASGPQAPPPPQPGAESFPLTHIKLKNGLTVIISENYSLPLVSVVVAYNVGSIHEQPGKTGLANLLENLMFQGSADIGPSQHISYVSRVGGTLSAVGSEDRTLFYQTVPSNQLALALWLESDRMRYLEFNEARFEKERSTILEDLQQRRATDPYLAGQAAFDQLIYPEFAFRHPLSGTEEDVRGLTLDDARSFYNGFYGPNNAVLCITGDINKVKALDLVSRYFDSLPRSRDNTTTFDPPSWIKKPVVSTTVDPLAQAPAFYMGFRLVPPATKENDILVLIDYILMRGRTSRLNRRLLSLDNKIAYQLAGGIERRRDRAVYKIFAEAGQPMIEPCQNAVFDELDKLKRSFLSADEMEKYKSMLKQDYYLRTSAALDRALYLVDAWFSRPNLDDVKQELGRYLAVTPIDVVGIANRFFTVENSVILNVKTK